MVHTSANLIESPEEAKVADTSVISKFLMKN